MAGIVATTAAVVEVLQTLLTPNGGPFLRVHHGPQEQLNEFPCCEVIFGRGTVTRNQPQQLERQRTPTGVVRIYERRNSDLPSEFARLEPLADAVVDLFGTMPHLTGDFDRFDATGWGDPFQPEYGKAPMVAVDVSWAATDADAGDYVQDW